MINELREWAMLLAELFICYMLVLEYKYDEKKDIQKKQRSTKTVRKTTTKKDGDSVVEESTEVNEPVADTPKDKTL